jgi:hypothetical protein
MASLSLKVICRYNSTSLKASDLILVSSVQTEQLYVKLSSISSERIGSNEEKRQAM